MRTCVTHTELDVHVACRALLDSATDRLARSATLSVTLARSHCGLLPLCAGRTHGHAACGIAATGEQHRGASRRQEGVRRRNRKHVSQQLWCQPPPAWACGAVARRHVRASAAHTAARRMQLQELRSGSTSECASLQHLPTPTSHSHMHCQTTMTTHPSHITSSSTSQNIPRHTCQAMGSASAAAQDSPCIPGRAGPCAPLAGGPAGPDAAAAAAAAAAPPPHLLPAGCSRC